MQTNREKHPFPALLIDSWPDKEYPSFSEYLDSRRGKNDRPTLGVSGHVGGNGKPGNIRK